MFLAPKRHKPLPEAVMGENSTPSVYHLKVMYKDIEAETKCPPLRRQHLQMYIYELKLCFHPNFCESFGEGLVKNKQM